VGIYVGDGKFVHAVNGSVIKSSLSSYAYQFRGWGYCGGFKLKTGEEPVGELESVTVENGRIQVSGWSYDPDSKKKAVTIQVYVGAKAGSGAKKTKLTANQKRTDIGELYEGIGNKHGFSASIKTKKTGKQTVYVYAVDVNDGSKVLLGKKKVTISK
jgi:hypothetical protein